MDEATARTALERAVETPMPTMWQVGPDLFVRLDLPPIFLWDVIEAIQKIIAAEHHPEETPQEAALRVQAGINQASRLAGFGAYMLGRLPDPSDAESNTKRDVLEATLTALYDQAETEKWTSREDSVLSYSYHMLRRRSLTRQEAAELASVLLIKHYTSDTWRKRVDRWAAARGLPKVAQRKRGR